MDQSLDPKRRRMFAVADQLGLCRAERIDLAEMLLRRDVSSWSDLDAAEMSRMLDAMEGYALVWHLIGTRTPQPAGTAK